MKYQLNHVYNEDCMKGMAEIPDNYFELAIVDPPYGIGNFVQSTGNVRGDAVEWNNYIPQKEYFEELRRISVDRIIWGANYYNCFETGAIVWVKNQPMKDFSKAEIASCTQHKKVEVYTQTWTNYVNTKKTKHPSEKPFLLYKWLLYNYAKEGDKILDTHVGSGSSIIACIDMGFEYMGFEIDTDYYNAMNDRIYHFTRQEVLF